MDCRMHTSEQCAAGGGARAADETRDVLVEMNLAGAAA